MTRKNQRKKTRGRKLRPWIRKTKRRIGGFIFTTAAILSALGTLAGGIATGAASSAAAYGTTKLIEHIEKKTGGRRRRRRIK